MSQSSQNPGSTTPAVEVEVDPDEIDSTYGDEVSSASTSIRSSMVRYEWKHGRRYHSYQAGAYNFPNDDREQERLDMVHHIYYRLLEDRLFLAPIKPNGLKILDIGTGTGIWPIHLGDIYPGASIVGNDLSPIQPSWVPPNVRFILDDVELDWTEPEKYDYIHCRYMAGSIKDWPRLVRQIYDNLRPGGWVEFQESANTIYSEDDSLKPDNALVQLMKGLMQACDQIGRTMDPAPSFKTWAEEASFNRVTEQRFRLPVGSWPKDPRLQEVGAFSSVNFFEGVEAFTAVPFRDILGRPREEVEILNSRVRVASRCKDIHAMFDFVVVTGQKPE
ncbi:methyltransferase domain-containing protein [Ilyonectria robusta]